MSETLGSLIDKLTIANIRLWHLEDIRRDKSLPDEKRLKAADSISEVNSQRNDYMDEIDDYLYQALQGRIRIRVPKVKIYGESKPTSISRVKKGGKSKKKKR